MGGRRKRKHGLFFGITSRFLMLVAAGLLVLSYLSLAINPAKIWFVTLFGLFFGLFLLLNTILFIWALKRRSGAMLIPLIAMVPAFFMVGRYYQISAPENEEEGVKIISYNVGRFALGHDKSSADGKMSRASCLDSVITFLKNENADIICLQEFRASDADALRSYLRKHFRKYDIEYYVFSGRSGCFGNVTISRYPTKGKGKITFEQSANLAIYSDYEVDGREFRVYNCHFQSYNISLSGIARSLKNDYRKAIRDTEEKVKHSVTLRPRQVDMVMKDIEACTKDAIVTGDFNDTPMSYTYNRMCRGRKDSFREAGKGSGSTFSMLGPFLRIDYVLVPKTMDVLSHKVVKKKYSDHYPVVAEIKFN